MKRPAIVLVILMFYGMTVFPLFGQKTEWRGDLTFSGAWALYPMAIKWGEEFSKVHPKVRIDVQAGGAGKGIADVLAGAVDFGMVSRGIHPTELQKGAFAIAVCKDAVVPTISEKNPLLDRVRRTGVKRETLIALWFTESIKTWGDVLGIPDKAPLHIYTRSDACGAAETWAEYLGGRQEDLKGVAVYGDPGLAEAVRRDPFGWGFNNINYAYDSRSKKPVPGLAILPIDLNGNGAIDDYENFYGDRDAVMAAIAGGTYPSPPARDLYLVTRGRPEDPLVIEFLRWVLSDGQKYVPESGYVALPPERLGEGMRKIEAR